MIMKGSFWVNNKKLLKLKNDDSILNRIKNLTFKNITCCFNKIFLFIILVLQLIISDKQIS